MCLAVAGEDALKPLLIGLGLAQPADRLARRGDLKFGGVAEHAEEAQAFEPAWEAYLGFKRLVRDAHGSASPQYRRINLPSRRGAPEVDEATPPSSQLN